MQRICMLGCRTRDYTVEKMENTETPALMLSQASLETQAQSHQILSTAWKSHPGKRCRTSVPICRCKGICLKQTGSFK